LRVFASNWCLGDPRPGSNAVRTRGICSPALAPSVNTWENVFLRGLVNVCVIREQEGCALCACRDFDGVFQKYPRKYPPKKSDGYVRNECQAGTCTRCRFIVQVAPRRGIETHATVARSQPSVKASSFRQASSGDTRQTRGIRGGYATDEITLQLVRTKPPRSYSTWPRSACRAQHGGNFQQPFRWQATPVPVQEA
jgi:hypothetical protein